MSTAAELRIFGLGGVPDVEPGMEALIEHREPAGVDEQGSPIREDDQQAVTLIHIDDR